MIKRYSDSELVCDSSSRRPYYDWRVDYARSNRAKCRVCCQLINKDELRLALMLQDEEGYKSTSWTHYECFWNHEETKKLEDVNEIYGFKIIKEEDQHRIKERLNLILQK
ncbi:hypothetical protein BJ944DRAFT_258374 [Cunninghamella echinulata]|nr:hypothetical protein BJ944DRAFT_258374 [Cunninghamella echinulata]